MPPDVVQQIVDVVRRLRSAGDGPVLVGVDGRSGSGKTVLAARLAGRLERAGTATTVVHLDDLYPGWTGLAAGLAVLCDHVLTPLRTGGGAAYPSWDWHADAPGPVRPVAEAPVVLVEGVGVLASGCAHLLDLRVWLEAPTEVRRSRALARDGGTFAPWWTTWAQQEDRLLSAGRPPADVVVDTQTDEAEWARMEP